MKKLIIALVVVAIAAVVAWQNRVDLLVWGAPKVRQIVSPVPPNVPTNWTKGPSVPAQPPAERPPNIILILTDDMGFNDISLYNGGAGDGSVMTPHIDALAREGVTFTNGYSANAVCAPSRATIMTGRYSTRFGFEFTPFPKIGATIFQWVQQMEAPTLPTYFDQAALASLPENPLYEFGMPAEEETIAEVLKNAGYYTAHIGKWHLGSKPGMRPQDQGFDDSLYMAGLLYQPEDHPDVVNAKRPDDAIERMVWANAEYAATFNGSKRFQPDGYLTDYYTREALKVVENNQHQPFFLYLAHWGVHNPLQATRADYDEFSHIEDHHLRVYSAMIRSIDRSVGQLMAKLKALGLDENTLVLLTADNGGADYIQLENINKPYRGWKLTQFEGGIHVPFMARWPAKIAPGSSMAAPVHHIDLLPTFAAAASAQLPVGKQLDGVDLLPFVRGGDGSPNRLPDGSPSDVPHDTLFWREGHHQTVLHRGWKMIRAERPDKRWLFDLTTDPTEQNNLAAEQPARVAAMEALLAAHNAEQAAPAWPSVLDSPKLIDKHGGQPYEEGDEYIYWPT